MASVWTVEQVDARISQFGSSLAGVEEKLVELESDATRQLLAASKLSGDTAAQWQSAAAELELLWKWFLALTDMLSAIAERRGSERSVSPALLDTLAALLHREPREIVADLPLPGASRSSRTPATVAELIGAMSTSAERVLGVVRQVEKVWGELVPRLAPLETSAAAAEQLACEAGIRPPNDVEVARRLIDELRARCTADPLSIDGDPAAAIDACLQRARVGVEEAVRSRRGLDGEISLSLADLEQAAAQLRQARSREVDSAAKINGDGGVLADIDRAAVELGRLGDELRHAREQAAGDWETAARRVAAVRQRSGAVLVEAHRLAAAGGADLAIRNELRGRLDAYRAKAQAIGRGEDLELEALYKRAMDALFTAPCDLVGSTALVSAYQRALTPAPRGST